MRPIDQDAATIRTLQRRLADTEIERDALGERCLHAEKEAREWKEALGRADKSTLEAGERCRQLETALQPFIPSDDFMKGHDCDDGTCNFDGEAWPCKWVAARAALGDTVKP